MNNDKYVFVDNEVNELSAIEIAYEIFEQTKKSFAFKALANEIADLKEMPSERLTDLYSQLYTQINIDGRFIHLGKNEWGLKSWYPIGKTEELQEIRDYPDEVISEEHTDEEVVFEDGDIDESIDDIEFFEDDLDEVEDNEDEEDADFEEEVEEEL